MIYNNTFYSDKIVNSGVLFLSNTAVGRGVNDMFLYNNLFNCPEGRCIEEGLMKGMTDATFKPDPKITREQPATVLYRYGSEEEVSPDLSGFADVNKVNAYAVNAMIWATAAAYYWHPSPTPEDEAKSKNEGVTVLFQATHALIATILMRYLEQ